MNYHTMNLYLSNKKTSSTIELPYNEPLLFKRKYVFNHRITIEWTSTFQTKECLQPSNYHKMNLYLSNKKNVFNHRITIQWTFTFQRKICLQPSNYHTMNLYLSTKKTSSTIELPSNETLHLKKNTSSTIELPWMNLYLSNKKMSSTIELL